MMTGTLTNLALLLLLLCLRAQVWEPGVFLLRSP